MRGAPGCYIYPPTRSLAVVGYESFNFGVIDRKTLVQWSSVGHPTYWLSHLLVAYQSPNWSLHPLAPELCRCSCSRSVIDCMIDFGIFFAIRSIGCLCVALLSLFFRVVSPSLSCLFILPASRQCGLGPKRWLRRCVLSQRSPGPY